MLRAARITHMLDDGVRLADVQDFADHDDPATTRLYWRRREIGDNRETPTPEQ